MSIINIRSIFTRVIFLLIAAAITTVYLSHMTATADTTIIAQKKKSTKTKTISNEHAPRISSIISTTGGYKIKGSGFGTAKSNLAVYEGKLLVPNQSVRSLNNTSINVQKKPLQTVDIRVVVSGNTSNIYKFSWKDPNLSKTVQTQKTTTKKQKITKSAPTKTAEPDTNEITKQAVDTKTVDKSKTVSKNNINDLKLSSQNNIQTKKQIPEKETTPKTQSVSSDPIKAVDDSKTSRTIKPIIKPLPTTQNNIDTKKQIPEQDTRSKTDSVSSDPVKVIDDGKIDRTIKPIIKPPITDNGKSSGGLNPIGRSGGSGSGGTMTAMNTGNSACNSCHLPVLESFPFWNWETSENDETVRFVRLKKPVSGSHPVWRGIKVDDWEAQFQSSNPNVVALTGSVNIDTLYMQQGFEIRGPGQATITGMSRFRSGVSPDGQENWHGLPQVSRQIVVTESASQIESFSFSPNPASVPGTTQGIVTFDGGTGEQTWVRWQRVPGPGDARAGGTSEQSKSVPIGASQITFDHETVDVSGSGTGSGSASIRVRWVRQGSSGFAEEIDQMITTLNVQDAVEIVDNSFSALLNDIFHDAKCLNCHGMASNNQTFQQHTNPNAPRFTIPQGQSSIQFISNVDNCSGCHSSSNGFADNWHAPPSNMNWAGKNAVQTCTTTINNTIPQTAQQMKHHLKDDLLIQWAINRMGAKGSGWNQKFNAWVDSWNGSDKNCD